MGPAAIGRACPTASGLHLALLAPIRRATSQHRARAAKLPLGQQLVGMGLAPTCRGEAGATKLSPVVLIAVLHSAEDRKHRPTAQRSHLPPPPAAAVAFSPRCRSRSVKAAPARGYGLLRPGLPTAAHSDASMAARSSMPGWPPAALSSDPSRLSPAEPAEFSSICTSLSVLPPAAAAGGGKEPSSRDSVSSSCCGCCCGDGCSRVAATAKSAAEPGAAFIGPTPFPAGAPNGPSTAALLCPASRARSRSSHVPGWQSWPAGCWLGAACGGGAGSCCPACCCICPISSKE